MHVYVCACVCCKCVYVCYIYVLSTLNLFPHPYPDTEGCFSILASLISGFVKDQADRKELVDLFTAAVTDSNSDKPTLRLKM